MQQKSVLHLLNLHNSENPYLPTGPPRQAGSRQFTHALIYSFTTFVRYMNLLREIRVLIWKEMVLEWRQRYALNGMLLYMVSTVIICYVGFDLRGDTMDANTWNVLWWIILLFTAVSAVAKSFAQERTGRFLYYYTLASPQAIILSKILYNALLLLLLAVVGYGLYALLLGNPVQDPALFLLNVGLGAVGFASTLTMVSAIASKAPNNSVLMAILSFPIIIPMLMLLLKISGNALDGLDQSVSTDEIITLLAINAIVVALSYLLFPYLWRS